jgi:hypothetical protein
MCELLSSLHLLLIALSIAVPLVFFVVADSIALYLLGWARVGKSFGVAALSGVLGYPLAFLLFAATIWCLIFVQGTMFQAGSGNATGSDAAASVGSRVFYAVTWVVLFSYFPAVSTFWKVIFLRAFEIKRGLPSWVFSVVTSLVGSVAVTIPVYILIYHPAYFYGLFGCK